MGAVNKRRDTGHRLLPRRAAIALVRLYQRTTRWWPSVCRYQPSCSNYALEALEQYGVLQGGWLSVKRFVRCNPWGSFGEDPVPRK